MVERKYKQGYKNTKQKLFIYEGTRRNEKRKKRDRESVIERKRERDRQTDRQRETDGVRERER